MGSLQLHLSLPLATKPRQHTPSFLRPGTHPVRSSLDRQSLFRRIAPVYDNLNDLLSLGQHRVWKRMAVSWSGAKEGDCVLDVCCGSGDLAFLLSEEVGPNGKVVGLDFAKEQLLVAQSRQHLRSKACYRNIKHRAMEEIYRVLKPGAKVSVLDFNKSSQPFISLVQEWMIDNAVVPIASSYGLEREYKYLKSSINEFLTGKELEKVALEAGFSSAKHFEIGGGLMGNLVAMR